MSRKSKTRTKAHPPAVVAERQPPTRRSHAAIGQLGSIAAALEAAQVRDDLWQLADFKDADATLNPTVRRAIRARARYEVANNPLVARVVETWATDVVRDDGPSLQIDTGDETVNEMIEAAWARFWTDHNIAETLRTAVRAEAVDGEAVNLIKFTEDGPIVVGLEADRLGSPYWLADNRSDYIDGVRLDPVTQKAVSYEILRAHPGTEYIDKISVLNQFDAYPAGLVLHAFRRTRPEQHRGVSRLTPVLTVSGQGRKYMEATVTREQLRAAFWVLYKSMAAGDDAVFAETDWWQTMKLPGRAGLSMILPEGVDPVALPKDSSPSDTAAFQQIIASQVAGCFNMPLFRSMGEGGESYASVRAQMEPYHATIQAERSMTWDVEWLRKLFGVWLMWFKAVRPDRRAANGAMVRIPWETLSTNKVEFRWPQRQLVVDPSREASAKLDGLKMGELTPEMIADTNDIKAHQERAASALGLTLEEYRGKLVEAIFGSVKQPAPVEQQTAMPANRNATQA
jgi:hypothetical protein